MEGLRDSLHRAGLEHVGIDHAHRSGDVDFLLDTVTHDDRLLDGQPVFLKGHVEGTAVPCDLGRKVTDRGHFEDIASLGLGKGEMSIDICGRSLEGSFDKDSRSDYRNSSLIDDDSRACLVLLDHSLGIGSGGLRLEQPPSCDYRGHGQRQSGFEC